MLRSVIVWLALVSLPTLTCAAEPGTRPGGPRIRPQDARTAKFLDQGLKRSPTMRALANRIEAGDVIVYVGVSPFMKSHLSGALSFVTTGGDFRYVRASINSDLVPDLMIATLAHEFQHVIEVLDEPTVVDDHSLAQLYRRIGIASSNGSQSQWETLAAQAMGRQVRRELFSKPATAVVTLAASDVDAYSRDL